MSYSSQIEVFDAYKARDYKMVVELVNDHHYLTNKAKVVQDIVYQSLKRLAPIDVNLIKTLMKEQHPLTQLLNDTMMEYLVAQDKKALVVIVKNGIFTKDDLNALLRMTMFFQYESYTVEQISDAIAMIHWLLESVI